MIRCLAVLFCLVLPLAAHAEEERRDFRDWSVLQSADGCVAVTTLGLAGRDSGLATIALYDRGDAGPGATATVRVPLGASLVSGIAYTHPGRAEAVGFAWQYCDDRTCLASGVLSEDEVARLKRGRRVFLGFRPLPGARSLVVPVSLLGFTRAWETVQSCG